LKSSNVLLAVWIVLAGTGCSKTESNKTPVARLDNQTLGLEDIRAHLDTSREPSQVQVQQYIQRWLTEESLYREAVERGLDRTDDMNQRVEDARRQFAINALLEQEVYSQQDSNFSAQDVRQYYDEHLKEFSQMHDVALVSYVLFKNRDAATEFRNSVLKGAAWNTAADQHASSILARMDSSYQTQASLVSSELWRVAASAAAHELSFPVSTDKGYYILAVWKFVKQGQTADLVLVEQEIRGRLTVESRRKLSERLVQKLRAKHAIEVFVNTASDSGMSKTAE
jgi:hypothetical protein